MDGRYENEISKQGEEEICWYKKAVLLSLNRQFPN